jgi:putative ABC transport system permease protein
MLKNLLTVSCRSLLKRKFYSLLNLIGLAISIAFAFLLWLYVKDQGSYDQHYSKADRIYRVNADLNMNGKRDVYGNAPRPAVPNFKADFPEVEDGVRIRGVGGLEIHTGTLEYMQKKVQSRQIFLADSTVFNIFEREIIKGNPAKALTEPNSIVLSESLASNLFGEVDPMDKSVSLLSEGVLVKVTGIMKDDPRNTHLPIDALVSWTTITSSREFTQWYGAHVYSYILLREGSRIETVEEKIPAFYDKYMKATFEQFNGKATFHFQPLLSIHLAPELTWEAYPHGSKTNIVALSVIIVFLLVFSCINYINLATARATERASEIGIRKMLGSPRRFLIWQFLTESILLAVFSGFFALVIAALLLPWFNMLSKLNLQLSDLVSNPNIVNIGLLSLGIGLLSGIYPAIYLSSLKSLQSMRGKFTSSSRGEILRKVLVSSQYFIAATLITSILFIRQQTNYIQNKDIGFDKSNLATLKVPDDTVSVKLIPALIEKLKASTHLAGATSTFYSLDKEANHFTPTLQNEDGTKFQTGADLIEVDYDFVKTIEAELIAGRAFAPGSGAENKYIMINEAAMRKFGWEKNPLAGVFVGWTEREEDRAMFHVVGVVKDFNMGVSYHEVNPMILFLNPRGGTNLYVRINKGQTAEGIEDIERAWAGFFPNDNLEFNFLDQSLNNLYQKEKDFLNFLEVLSIIILTIASLGIIGLIAFTTALRRKEIAIRKVLGSPLIGIASLLSQKFVTLMLIAHVVAIPVTYSLMKEWLNNFAYRIEINVWPFAIALLTCSLFTIVSLLYHTLAAATSNPVDALKHE